MRNREEKKRNYSSATSMAEKKEAGFQASYLKLPKGIKLYRPKVGKALLDVVPFTAQEGNPNADEGQIHWERTFWVHRNIGPNQETLICPAKTAGEKCPVCEARARLSMDDDEDAEEMRKTLNPKERQLILIRDAKEPDKGLQLIDLSTYAFGDEILKSIRSADEGEDWELFFTLEDGKTLRVTWEEETIGRGQKFIKAARIDFKDRAEALEEEILDEAPCLDEIPIVPEYKELKAKFLAAGKDEDDDDDDDDDEPKSKKRVADDDDDEEDRPKSKSGKSGKETSTDDDEEETPKSKKKPAADEDDDDDEPVKKKRVVEEDEEEEEPVKKKKKVVEDEEEEEPAPKKKKKPAADEDDDDEPKSKKGSKEEEPDDWSDFDDEPKKKKKVVEDEEEEEEPAPKKKKKVVEDED